ncbi:MAG TPA: hypothetical protein VJZ49_08815 [Syntrophales bacterium]|nr:hypothetical protein [Syntrophales bacterium]
METAAAEMEGFASMQSSDFVYEAIKGIGKVGGYLNNILADTMYYAGKYVAYVRSICSGLQDSPYEAGGAEGKITIMSLVKSDALIDEADKREFYMHFGRDMVEMMKSGLESDNLTIIDLSRYKL